MKLKELAGYTLAFTLTFASLITWFGHDFYDVTGIKQPKFPMNILIWLIPISKMLLSIGVGYMFLIVWQLKQKMNASTENEDSLQGIIQKINNIDAQNSNQHCFISLLNYTSFKRVEMLAKSPFNPTISRTQVGWDAYPKEVQEYIESEQLGMKDFLRTNFPKLTGEEIDAISRQLRLNYQ